MIELQKFDSSAYEKLISWIDTKEILMQFGGPEFTFPLTAEQLDKSLSNNNRHAFKVMHIPTSSHIGHCEIHLNEDSAKFARIIIGDELYRGQGLGTQLMHLLIQYCIDHLQQHRIELNVFDWNKAAIRCYEKVGFKINPNKSFERTVNGQTWVAINMVLERSDRNGQTASW